MVIAGTETEMTKAVLLAVGAVLLAPTVFFVLPNTFRKPTIFAIGDSLTRGAGVDPTDAYPAKLERRLHADGYRYELINDGINGHSSAGSLTRVIRSLAQEPDIVILETGINDALQCADPELIKANIARSVFLLGDQGTVIVLAGMRTSQECGTDYSTAFEQIYETIAKESGAILVPNLMEGVVGVAGLTQEDGLHPTAAGYDVIVDTIYPYVVEAIEKRR